MAIFINGVETETTAGTTTDVGQPPLIDYFGDVADGAAPNANKWAVTEDNAGAVTVEWSEQETKYCRLLADVGAADDTYMTSTDNYIFDPSICTYVIFEATFKVVDFEGEWALGLFEAGASAEASDADLLASMNACIHGDNDTVDAVTSDEAVVETTDLVTPTWLNTENTDYKIKIVVSATDVRFYIGDVLRVTHETNIPINNFYAVASVKNTNGIATDMHLMPPKVWTE